MLKATQNKKKKHNKIFILARGKLDSIESKTSQALLNNEISHEDFMTTINKERKYRELKESIRMRNSQRSNAEKLIWSKKVKKLVLMKFLGARHLLITV